MDKVLRLRRDPAAEGAASAGADDADDSDEDDSDEDLEVTAPSVLLLCKWRGLNHVDCTWERHQDVVCRTPDVPAFQAALESYRWVVCLPACLPALPVCVRRAL